MNLQELFRSDIPVVNETNIHQASKSAYVIIRPGRRRLGLVEQLCDKK